MDKVFSFKDPVPLLFINFHARGETPVILVRPLAISQQGSGGTPYVLKVIIFLNALTSLLIVKTHTHLIVYITILDSDKTV